jgi:hypothetical protein
MTRQRLLTAVRSILIGWPTLLLIAFLLKRPLLALTAPILGAQWIATAALALDCTVMAATGWVVGRLNRASPIFAVLVFAATLTFWDFTPLLAINIPWLLRLAALTLGDSGSWSSLLSESATQIFLFGSLLAGGLLSRPPASPVSIVAEVAQ